MVLQTAEIDPTANVAQTTNKKLPVCMAISTLSSSESYTNHLAISPVISEPFNPESSKIVICFNLRSFCSDSVRPTILVPIHDMRGKLHN